MLFKGETYGRWTLDRRIGTGISGEIWAGRDADGGLVALKFYTDNNYITAIRKAAFPEPPLDSPFIATVLEVDLKQNLPYVATEHLDGA